MPQPLLLRSLLYRHWHRRVVQRRNWKVLSQFVWYLLSHSMYRNQLSYLPLSQQLTLHMNKQINSTSTIRYFWMRSFYWSKEPKCLSRTINKLITLDTFYPEKTSTLLIKCPSSTLSLNNYLVVPLNSPPSTNNTLCINYSKRWKNSGTWVGSTDVYHGYANLSTLTVW